MARIRSTRAEHPGGFWSPDSILERHTGWGCTPRADTSLQQTALFLLPGEGTRSPAARPLQGSGAGLWAGPAHRAGGQEAACEALINFALGRAPRQVPGTPRPPLCPGSRAARAVGGGPEGRRRGRDCSPWPPPSARAPSPGLPGAAGRPGARGAGTREGPERRCWCRCGRRGGSGASPEACGAPEDGRVRGLSRPGGRGQAAVRGRGRRWGGDGCRQGPGVPGWR